MKVKITPIGESAQLIEFNVSLPCGARASVAPVSTLTITQRWAKVINTATTGAASPATSYATSSASTTEDSTHP